MFHRYAYPVFILWIVFFSAAACWGQTQDSPVVSPEHPQAVEMKSPDETRDGSNLLDHLLPLEGEKPIPSIPTEVIDRAGEKMGRFMDEAVEQASEHLGDWVKGTVIPGITWLRLLFSASLLLLLLTVERTLRGLMSRRLRREEESETGRAWLQVVLRSLGKPLSLLLWVYGAYGALTPLLGAFEMADGSNTVHSFVRLMADVGGAIAIFWFGTRVLRLVDRFFVRWAATQNGFLKGLAGALSQSNRAPLKLLLFVLLSGIVLSFFAIPQSFHPMLKGLFALGLIVSLTWLIIEGARVLENFLLSFYRVDVKDNLQARRIHTQLRFLRRFIVILALLIGLASTLMLFDKVRQLGTSLLASAGVLGIVVGLAAQRSIANLLVGLQIAATQPITLDDVVIIEGEWGRVEEINSTYVVVRIWDMRRLIVPLTYFTEKPFQNWTRTSAQILGTVFLYVDYTVDVEGIREKLHRLLQDSEYWDGEVWGLQVTDANERTMELRCLMSAADSSNAWNLRCEIREKLISHIQRTHPETLPRMRAQIRMSGGLSGEDALRVRESSPGTLPSHK